ncbi:ABC transporter ATP-binding protein [Halobiforma lacisalsi AJ5]|uniref:ABC transporter ATP-binding protein n=1 Tax=Natronobacterium lacisalsi AJ5 TaxID=358396 RepID=M0LMC2_NATLA|nr:oligopeptide/dipeptide ABC transporter ATP-binding protein [Halobiforma lacisalsi]APW96997.1 ABC transporter ATP-binding protein [Halobiforma lacisalsi AJ5]EMA34712.1 oligopeptide/dipeptide ABC transporter ATPase [Halobiforma lacisalsi AJ5]
MSDTAQDPGSDRGPDGNRSVIGSEMSGEDVAHGETLLEVDSLKKYFSQESGLLSGVSFDPSQFPPIEIGRNRVKAVDDVNFEIRRGETLGLVGESGCGKSTLGRTILRLLKPTDGNIYFKDQDLADLSGEALRQKRAEIQMIFQDPQSSLDPRMKVGRIIEEPMRAHGMLDDEGREARAKDLLEKVGLDSRHYNRHPHAFSGGQRQRVNLARALSVNPDFIVCDEPVSALDVSIQAQVLNTMEELQEEFGLTYLFIAHDLSVIRHISDRVAVMYLGNVVELAEKEELFENPQHPYTEALLESIPVPDPRQRDARGVLEGEVPSPVNPPSGCRFRTRCPRLIAPDEYAWTDEEWAHTRAFLRAVKRRTFEPMTAAEIEAEFFGGELPTGDAGEIVRRAIDRVATDRGDAESRVGAESGSDAAGGPEGVGHPNVDWAEATELLLESFARQSICARERPAYEVEPEYGTEPHFAACHLHR